MFVYTGVQVVFGLGAHRLLGIGARGEHSCCVFDVVILPKAAYQKLGAQDQVHSCALTNYAPTRVTRTHART